jgi:hypothetical protein
MRSMLTIDDILTDIAAVDRAGLRALARASERHLLSRRVPVATLEKDALADAGDTLSARVQADRRRARKALSGRLAEFKELRADHTYKTALNVAVDAAVLTVHASGYLGEASSDLLRAPWVEAFRDRPSGER